MVSKQRVLLVAAEPREFDGLAAHCSGMRRVDLPVYWAREAECAGRRFSMVANGAGPVHAARAVDAACAASKPDAIVSVGFCGALDPALNIGDVFVATTIQTGEARVDVCVPQAAAPHANGVLASIDHVAGTAAEKQALRASGAGAVEMEAAGIARRAADYRIPLFCVRSVTDLAGQSFTVDFNQALRSDGHFDTISILKSAFRKPGTAWPELIRLRHDCQVATRTLGDFIAGCQF